MLALLAGISVFCGMPHEHHLGNLGGSVLVSIGSLALIAGLCVRCVKNNAEPTNPVNRTDIHGDHLPEQTPSVVRPINQGSLLDISQNTMEVMAQGYCPTSKEEKVYFKSGIELHRKSSMHFYNQALKPVVAKNHQQIEVWESEALMQLKFSRKKGIKWQ